MKIIMMYIILYRVCMCDYFRYMVDGFYWTNNNIITVFIILFVCLRNFTIFFYCLDDAYSVLLLL